MCMIVLQSFVALCELQDASEIEPVSSLQAAIFSGLGMIEKLEKLGILEQRERLTLCAQPRSRATAPAVVAPLRSSSSKFPIAPDCKATITQDYAMHRISLSTVSF